MANTDRVKGFEPYGNVLRIRPYTAAGAIYPGDLVEQESGGRVAAADASSPCIGVAMNYASAAGEEVLVADHPDQEFVCQADGTEIDELTDMGLNYNFVAGTASTLYRRSGMEIDADSGVTNSNLPLKVLRLLPRVNNALGGFAVCVCKINNHQLSGGTGTTGV